MSDASDISAILVTTTIAAAVVTAQQREEETMTPYTPQDLAEGWEFKILRSRGAKFADPATLRAALAEEARAQWTLVEKFDDMRLRLKRPAGARARDGQLDFDPYRIWYGGQADRRTALIALACSLLFVAALVALGAFLLAMQPR